MLKSIDSQTLKTDVIKSVEKLRVRETDPKVCMKMLKLYEAIGKVLGPEEIGMKILPGVIPMLISGQFTKGEFKEMMGSVHGLLDQIESYRTPSLPDDRPAAAGVDFSGAAGASASFGGAQFNPSSADDPFGTMTTSIATPSTGDSKKPDDFFAGMMGSSAG